MTVWFAPNKPLVFTLLLALGIGAVALSRWAVQRWKWANAHPTWIDAILRAATLLDAKAVVALQSLQADGQIDQEATDAINLLLAFATKLAKGSEAGAIFLTVADELDPAWQKQLTAWCVANVDRILAAIEKAGQAAQKAG